MLLTCGALGAGAVLGRVAAAGAGALSLHQGLQGQLGAGVGVAAQAGGAARRVDTARLGLQAGAHRAAAAARLPHQLGAGRAGGRGAGGQALRRAGRAAEQHLGQRRPRQRQRRRRRRQQQPRPGSPRRAAPDPAERHGGTDGRRGRQVDAPLGPPAGRRGAERREAEPGGAARHGTARHGTARPGEAQHSAARHGTARLGAESGRAELSGAGRAAPLLGPRAAPAPAPGSPRGSGLSLPVGSEDQTQSRLGPAAHKTGDDPERN